MLTHDYNSTLCLENGIVIIAAQIEFISLYKYTSIITCCCKVKLYHANNTINSIYFLVNGVINNIEVIYAAISTSPHKNTSSNPCIGKCICPDKDIIAYCTGWGLVITCKTTIKYIIANT